MSTPLMFANGRYQVVRELGKGGQKIVYLVRDTTLKRECALSLIGAEILRPEDIKRFENEAQTLAKMGAQPHVVTVYDMGEDAGRPYLVCEWVSGGDLAGLLKGRALPIEHALRLTADILHGLAVAHDRGVIHRDLKPSNVWIDDSGSAKLGDFGIALAHDRSRLTATGSVTGTPAYCAPEQLDNRPVDGRTDLYALGCVLYEMLTGRPPFSGTVVAVISQQLHALPMTPSLLAPELGPEIDRFVLSLLAKDPSLRPASARGALLTLAALGALPSPAPYAAPATPAEITPLAFASEAPALASAPQIGLLRRIERLCLALVLIGGPVGAWLAYRDHPVASGPPHRVVILAMKGGERPLESKTASMISSRLIEEVDRYAEFRPVSAVGLTLAMGDLLNGGSELPNEAQVVAIAERLGADTVVAISSAGLDGEDFELRPDVFDTKDPAKGLAARRVRLRRSELDEVGPARAAEAIVEGLGRHWGAALTPQVGVAAAAVQRFEDFQRATVGESYCVTGRFEACERIFRELLQTNPDNAFYLMKLACALSYLGKDAEAEEVITRANIQRSKLTNRRSLLIFDQDQGWLKAERLRRTGKREESQAEAKKLLSINEELEHDYGDPWGAMYAAATWQYLLEDIPRARSIYARLRAQHPDLYPPYYEEARLLRGDGSSTEGRQQASLLLSTYLTCFPSSELAGAARAALLTLHLDEPAEKPACPGTKS